MATPAKRVCYQATRHFPRPRSLCRCRQPGFTQWQQSIRPFSDTPRQPARQPQENTSITPFPEASIDATIDSAYEDDEISSLGHAELDQHRELREMIRLAAWEMPMLSQFAQPYHSPSPAEQPLRWRYTTYMGEVHPAARKVVVEFRPDALQNLEEKHKIKLLKLAGPRYDPETGIVKMSCESFETQAQNKRYLGDTIQKLIAEAKDPEADSFEDVPLDTRHSKPKKRLQFPTAWLLTEDRKRVLGEARKAKLLEEGRKVEDDTVASGVAAIEAARQIELQQVEEPVMAQARQPLPKGKMGKQQMGRGR